MDETEREPEREPQRDTHPAGEQSEAQAQGPQPWRAPDGGRRRRGRRGRGGRGPMGPPIGPPPGGPARPPEDDEGSSQMREVGAYERRQRQPQRGPWRGPGFRPQGAGRPPYAGARPPYAGPRPGGFRPQVGGPRQQRYQDMVRRATAAPRSGPPEEAGEPIAGPHAVLEALRAGRQIRRVYVANERGARTGAVNDLIREAQERRVLVRFVDRLDVERLSPGVEHQGVVAIAEGRQGVELDELLLHLDTLSEPPLLLIIDSLQDPQNFGVLLRSAEGAGADGVVIPRHRQVGLTPAVARTSAGASEHLLIAEVVNLRQAIDALREKGIWVVGTDDSGDMEWDEVDYRGATAIVVGGEGEGIRRLVLEGCDQVVRIPMQGQVSSLNAAAAGTVVLFEAVRQRVRDAAPPQLERPARVEEAIEAEEPATNDLLLDEDAPVGDDVRGDDRDVAEFAEAEEPEAVQAEEAEKPKKRAPTKRTTRKKAD
jgi:23S rRNA (guanosine2251-2'-O)-methyltransferase